MSKKKRGKPDIIVWDEERGYYAKNLPYGSDLGAPTISVDDVQGWRQKEVVTFNQAFEKKFDELKQQFISLMNEYDLNQFIYTKAEYNFLPIIGHTYHLYLRENGVYFLSLIPPDSWKANHIMSVQMDSNNKWNKI